MQSSSCRVTHGLWAKYLNCPQAASGRKQLRVGACVAPHQWRFCRERDRPPRGRTRPVTQGLQRCVDRRLGTLPQRQPVPVGEDLNAAGVRHIHIHVTQQNMCRHPGTPSRQIRAVLQ